MSDALTSRHKGGSFDFFRLAAAIMVLFSHSYALLQQSPAEPLRILSFGRHDLGEIAVYIFFAMSGYLVTLSWQRDPNALRFLQRRALRVFPALAAVVIASVLLLGPMMTRLEVGAYFSSLETWTYLAKATSYSTQHTLPGVFDANPLAHVVNGSLWSLRLEVTLYVALAALGMLGLLGRRLVSVSVVLACLGVSEALMHRGSVVLATYSLNTAVFFIGTLMAQAKLPHRTGSTTLIAWIIWIVTLLVVPNSTALFVLTFTPALVLTVISIRLPITSFGDYSYGIYLWAFPVQQCLIAAAPGLQPLQLFTLAAPITLGLAALSWHIIESWALSFKPGMSRASALPADQRVASAASA